MSSDLGYSALQCVSFIANVRKPDHRQHFSSACNKIIFLKTIIFGRINFPFPNENDYKNGQPLGNNNLNS